MNIAAELSAHYKDQIDKYGVSQETDHNRTATLHMLELPLHNKANARSLLRGIVPMPDTIANLHVPHTKIIFLIMLLRRSGLSVLGFMTFVQELTTLWTKESAL